MNTTEANSVENWDRLHGKEGLNSWRGKYLKPVYSKVISLIKPGYSVIDIACGTGQFIELLNSTINCSTIECVDHSSVALGIVKQRCPKVITRRIDLNNDKLKITNEYVTCFEAIEHFSSDVRNKLFSAFSNAKEGAFISVPNNRLNHEQENQHDVCFTAALLKQALTPYFIVLVGFF
jgi:trans-aconitate methyltransferase